MAGSSSRRFLRASVVSDHRNAPVEALGNLRVMFAVDDIDEAVERLRNHGTQLVGDVATIKMYIASATSAGRKCSHPTRPRTQLIGQGLPVAFVALT